MGGDFHASSSILIALQKIDSNDCIVHLWHILQRNKSFFLPFMLVGPEIHNSTYLSNVLCSWYGFPGCYKCNSSKTNWDVSELFSIPTPHPTTTRCSRAICFFKFFLFFLMHRLLPFPKKKILEKKMLPSTLDMVPSPSTWSPRPSTLDKKIDSQALVWHWLFW